MNAQDRRTAKDALADLRAGRVAQAIASLERLLPGKRGPRAVNGATLKEDREARQQAAIEKRRTVRERVEDRADGVCEVAGFLNVACSHSLEMDHWEGGSGNKASKESVETCWMICGQHHHLRTHNVPSAEAWNMRRASFCADKEIPFRRHIEHAPLRAKAGP